MRITPCCSNRFKLKLLLTGFLLFAAGTCGAKPFPKDTLYSAVDSLAIAELTAEQLLFLESDFIPLTFGEITRPAPAAWRGMPPGFLDYRFEGIRLEEPLWGYWDNQLMPIEMIRQRRLEPGALQYRLIPIIPRSVKTPVSRIAYSQDFQFGLSYVDAALTQFYRPKSYFRLSGNNLVRPGSSPANTRGQINTYRGQIHHQISTRLSLDIWFWQLRHLYRLTRFDQSPDTRRNRRIGNILWTSLIFKPDSLRRLRITPYLNFWEDRHRNRENGLQRKSEIRSTGITLAYQQTGLLAGLQLTADVQRHQITRGLYLQESGQWEGSTQAVLSRRILEIDFRLGGGYRSYEKVGSGADFSAEAAFELPLRVSHRLSMGQHPRNAPLAALFWKGDSIAPLASPLLPRRLTADYRLTYQAGNQFRLSFNPFYAFFENGWEFRENSPAFVQRSFENSGFTVTAEKEYSFFSLKNNFTYSSNYQETYAPQINNVATAGFFFSAFQRALLVEAYAIYHFLGKWRLLDYDPLVNQYSQTAREESN
ncbi:MAG: hypothetical protein WAN36_15220, partial [Calditrichia bacterium]